MTNAKIIQPLSSEEAVALLERLRGTPVIFDTETDGLLVRDGQHKAHYLGLTPASHPAVCFIVRAPFSKALLEALEGAMLVGHNARFDAHALGLRLTGAAPYDTMLRVYAHNTTTTKTLDDIAPRLGLKKVPTPKLIEEGRIAEMDPDEVGAYLADDCVVTCALFRQQVKAQGPARPVNILDFDAERAVLRMERRGVRLLPDAMAALSVEVDAEIARTRAELASLGCNLHLNVNSSQQVKRLFEYRGVRLPVDRETGRPTTGKMAMEILERKGDPLAPAVTAARKALKFRNSFCTPLPTFVSPITGLIHGSVKTAHTKTGRFSYESPGLQQVPKRGPLGDAARRCFTSASGRVVGADFSQVEMRVAAAYSGDPGLLGLFERGEDLHTSVAAQVSGKRLDEVSKEERFKAKAVNFGILNGMGAKRLAHEIKAPVSEAQRFLDDYLRTFSRLHEWMEGVWRAAEEVGVVCTLGGRQRVFSMGEETRPGISVVVQGSAADLMRAALVAVDKAGLQPILAVHDELLCDATLPTGGLTRGEGLATMMEMAANTFWQEHNGGDLPVRFKAEPGEGATWGDC